MVFTSVKKLTRAKINVACGLVNLNDRPNGVKTISPVRAVSAHTESLKPLYLFVFTALSDAKPLRTFAGNAL
jgi:hypothetical protein